MCKVDTQVIIFLRIVQWSVSRNQRIPSREAIEILFAPRDMAQVEQ